MGKKRKFAPRGDMKYWEAQDLYDVLNNPKQKATVKDKVMNIFKEREVNGKKFLESFFNPSKNKFLNLAKWQLYREGKAVVYNHGKYTRFSNEDPVQVFDKMVEVKDRFDKYRTGKSTEDKQICDMVREELQVWKR